MHIDRVYELTSHRVQPDLHDLDRDLTFIALGVLLYAGSLPLPQITAAQLHDQSGAESVSELLEALEELAAAGHMIDTGRNVQ